VSALCDVFFVFIYNKQSTHGKRNDQSEAGSTHRGAGVKRKSRLPGDDRLVQSTSLEYNSALTPFDTNISISYAQVAMPIPCFAVKEATLVGF